MHILDIVILALSYSDSGRTVTGEIQFSILERGVGERRLIVRSETATSSQAPHSTVLVRDALVQLAEQLGRADVTFAKGLAPLQGSLAA